MGSSTNRVWFVWGRILSSGVGEVCPYEIGDLRTNYVPLMNWYCVVVEVKEEGWFLRTL